MSKKIFNLLLSIIFILIALTGCQMGPVTENDGKTVTTDIENMEQDGLSKVTTSSISIPSVVALNTNLKFSWYTGDNVDNPYYFKKYYSKIYMKLEYNPIHPDVIEKTDWIYITTIYKDQTASYTRLMDKLGKYQFRVDVWIKEGLKNTGQTYNYLSKSYYTNWTTVKAHVDVKIIYDQNAQAKLSDYGNNADNLAGIVELALNNNYAAFGKWNIEFYTNPDSQKWLELSSTYFIDINGNLTINSLQDIQNWLIVNHSSRSLPSGEGHGSKFDLVIMFTSLENLPDPSTGKVIGIGGDDSVIINLGKLDGFPVCWSSNGNAGLLSSILHEVGHCYGINGKGEGVKNIDWQLDDTGDTYKKRQSVMDYYYGNRLCSGKFDDGHLRTINKKIGDHSY